MKYRVNVTRERRQPLFELPSYRRATGSGRASQPNLFVFSLRLDVLRAFDPVLACLLAFKVQNPVEISMANSPILIREQRYHQIKAVLARLRLDASARLVVLVDKDGQQIAVHGELGELDTTSLASLVAGNVAATGGMAKLIGEEEFPTLSHEGERESIHISVIGRVLLVVVFDDRSSLGLVKLRSKQISQELAIAFAEVERDSELSAADKSLPFSGITDEEIDSLFSQT